MSPRFFTPTLLLRKSDADLARLVTQGHEAAFDAIVLRHRGYLLRHCRRMLRDQRAEDAVQQTFVRALGALRAGTEVHELRAWLSRIARNVALDELAARGADHAELNEEWVDHARSGEYERRASLRDALRAVAALPDRQRTALLRSAAGDSPAAIAEELGVTSVAARQLLHRARVSVRAAVRVISPPPLVWLSRRLAMAWERIPRVAGVPAGAAPVASKIAVVVVASATVAAPVTVIRSVLSQHPRAPRRHATAARSAPAPAAIRPRITIAAAAPSLPAMAAPPATPAPRSAPPVRPPRPSRPAPSRGAPAHTPPPSGPGPGVSATANGAPVGSGSSAGATSGGPVASDASAAGSTSSDGGPVSSASASAPTQPSTSSDSSASSTDTSSSSSATSSGDSSTSATGP